MLGLMATGTGQSLVFAFLAQLGRQVQVSELQITSIEIIHKRREADVLIAQGKAVLQTCKQLGITEQTYYRWRNEYGGMKVDQAQRRICRALGISRNTVRYTPQPREDEAALTADILRLAGQFGRYGYRQIHALLLQPAEA